MNAEPDPTVWLEAIAAEWHSVRREERFSVDEVDTLYVGGGTPSLLGDETMSGLLRCVDSPLAKDYEWTAEANPESLTPTLATAWREAGVNRLSVGVQSFQEDALRWMGRLHGPEGARRAMRAARRGGFTNVSLDLIFALPSHLKRDWRHDLEEAIRLGPEHVSLYGLGIEPGSALGRAVREGREPGVDDARYAEEFLEAAEVLSAAGYEHYEVSNFSRPGSRSRHNSVYWTGEAYLGLGNGAHSYCWPLRRWNLRDWSEYRDRAVAGALPLGGEEKLNEAETRLEGLWLGLRTREGVAIEALAGRQKALVRGWAQNGLAVRVEGRVRLTARGWLQLDRLAVDLDAARSNGSDNTTDCADG